MKDLIRENEDPMQLKVVWKDKQEYDSSFLFPEIYELEYDEYPGEVHVHTAKTVPNLYDQDELKLAQAKKLCCVEWLDRVDAIRKELSSLIQLVLLQLELLQLLLLLLLQLLLLLLLV